MLAIRYSSIFRKDYESVKRKGCDVNRYLPPVIELLAQQKPLPPEYPDHILARSYAGFRGCYISPDWILVYRVQDGNLILFMMRTGKKSDLEMYFNQVNGPSGFS